MQDREMGEYVRPQDARNDGRRLSEDFLRLLSHGAATLDARVSS